MDDIYDSHRQLTYKQMMDRDKRRFMTADTNVNGFLSKEEFADFLHPGELQRFDHTTPLTHTHTLITPSHTHS